MCFFIDFLVWWPVHWLGGVLKSPNTIVLLSISPFCLLVFALSIEVILCWVHKNLQLLYLPLGFIFDSYVLFFFISAIFFILRSILSNMRMATLTIFWFSFAWNIFSHPFTFSWYVSVGLKWVSYGPLIHGFCFCIHSVSLCLLVGVFNLFIFKVIIDIHIPTAIFLIGIWIFYFSVFPVI